MFTKNYPNQIKNTWESFDLGHEVIIIEIEIPTVAKPRAVVVCKAREEHAETSELAR